MPPPVEWSPLPLTFSGGFRTFVAAIPDRETSIAVFSNSAVSVDQLGWAIARGRDRAEAPQTSTRMQWVIGGGLLLWLGWFVVAGLLKRRSTDVLTIVQSIIGALFVISVWARSAPPALFIPGIEVVLAVVAAGVSIMHVTHALRDGETTRFTGGRGPWQIFAVAAQIGVFGMLAVLLW